MLKIAQRVAFRVLADEFFNVRDGIALLKGEVVSRGELGFYERALSKVIQEYLDARSKYEQAKGPQGESNPQMAGLGRDLQVIRKKGLKARARVEIARALQKSGVSRIKVHDAVLSLLDQVDSTPVVSDARAWIKGEELRLNFLHNYKALYEKAKKAYDDFKAEVGQMRGRERGLGGKRLKDDFGVPLRKAKARYDVARWMSKNQVDVLTV